MELGPVITQGKDILSPQQGLCANRRAGKTIFAGEANTASMKRTLPELVDFLTHELDFPQGVLLMTGTCLVPDDFTLEPDDFVYIQVGELMLENQVHI